MICQQYRSVRIEDADAVKVKKKISRKFRDMTLQGNGEDQIIGQGEKERNSQGKDPIGQYY